MKKEKSIYEKTFDLLYTTALLAGQPIRAALKFADKHAKKYAENKARKKK